MSPAVERRYVRTRSGELHVRCAGDRGPKLLMLQVLPFGGMLFDALLPLLAEAGVRCVAPDLMGYGRSDKRPGLWRVEDFADDVDDAVHAMSFEPDVALGGHFAAMVAASFCARTKNPPRALVLDGAPVWSAELRAGFFADPAMAPVAIAEDGSHMAAYWSRTLGMLRRLAPGTVVDAGSAARIMEAVIAFAECSVGPPVLQAMVEFDMAEALPRITLPTLALGAQHDSQCEHYPTLLAKIPDCAGHFFEGTHPLHDLARPERAAEYAEPVLRFVMRHAAAAGR